MSDAPNQRSGGDHTHAPEGAAQPQRGAGSTLTACFPDFATARSAIEELEASGIEGTLVEVEDDSLQRAKEVSDTGNRDTHFVNRAVTKLRRGALVGLLVGVLAGIVLGFLLFGGGPAIAVIGTIIATAAAGALVGAAMGGIWNHPQSPAWEETLEAPAVGEACLEITVTDEEETGAVREVLQRHSGELRHAQD